jgi:hypothetical protein
VPAGTGEARLTLPGVADGPPPALLDLREGVVAGAGVELVAGERIVVDRLPADHPAADRGTPAAEPAEHAPRPAAGPPGRPSNALPTLVDMEPVSLEDPVDATPADGPAAEPAPVPTPPAGAGEERADPPPAGEDRDGPDAVGTGPIGESRPALRTPQRAEAILGVAPAEPARAPLEAGDVVGTGGRPSGRPRPGPGAGEARGHLCSRGPPQRPPLALLRALRHPHERAHGGARRRPATAAGPARVRRRRHLHRRRRVPRGADAGVDERVRSGALRAIVVEDRSGAVSRVHAEIRVDGWDVVLVDSGSRNGTHVAGPGEPAWTPLPPRHTHRLVPGTRVRMGARTFVFESPSGVR